MILSLKLLLKIASPELIFPIVLDGTVGALEAQLLQVLDVDMLVEIAKANEGVVALIALERSLPGVIVLVVLQVVGRVESLVTQLACEGLLILQQHGQGLETKNPCNTTIQQCWQEMGTRDQCALKGTLLKAALRIRLRIRNGYVFRHAGSGSFSTKDGSGSGSFNHQAKTVRKTLILLLCDSFMTFFL